MKNIRNDPEDTGNEHIVLVSNGNTSSDNSVKGWGHDVSVFWIKDILAEKYARVSETQVLWQPSHDKAKTWICNFKSFVLLAG